MRTLASPQPQSVSGMSYLYFLYFLANWASISRRLPFFLIV
jgi:hypothetical protein